MFHRHSIQTTTRILVASAVVASTTVSARVRAQQDVSTPPSATSADTVQPPEPSTASEVEPDLESDVSPTELNTAGEATSQADESTSIRETTSDPVESAESQPTTLEAAPALPESSAADGTAPGHDLGAGDAAETPSAVSGAGVAIGFSLGYASPSGDISKGNPLDRVMTASIPIGADATLILPGGVAFGVYLQIAPGLSGEALDGCGDCSVFGGRIGLHGGKHFNPKGALDPWVTLGLGYEFLQASEPVQVSGLDSRLVSTVSAMPEVTATAGLAIGNAKLKVGPYAFASWASFSSEENKITCDEAVCANDTLASVSDEIPSSNRAGHYWLGAGIRGSWML